MQSSNLNEELGQVEYVFSDKTGTLTCNVMEFKMFSAGAFTYGTKAEQTRGPTVENVNFEDSTFWEHFSSPTHPNFAQIEKLILHLALCHTIILDESTGKYNASSPDELALVNAAKFFGAVFVKRDEDNNMVVRYGNTDRKYRLLNILEFTSTRKRMSVLVEDEQGRIQLLTKGADSVVFKSLSASNYVQETKLFVDGYAQEGLRTLLLASRYVSLAEYKTWNEEFEHAMQTVNNREEAVAAVNEKIEKGLELVGSTAIEDKLQEGVPETIRYMRDAGIKVWVLTGDKVETAINIGYSSGLIDGGMAQFMVTQ